MEIQTIGVIGAGVMGSGIAQLAATSGFEVILEDIDEGRLALAQKKIGEQIAKQVAKGRIDAEAGQVALGRIRAVTSFGTLSGAHVVIEAVPEDLSLKRQVFRELDGVCSPDAILASNTSSLSVAAIATASCRPERVIGMHFFNPAPVMKLVEVIPSRSTKAEIVGAVQELARALGKTPVLAVDYPGFIVSRVIDVMINEAIQCVMDGNSPEAVDQAMQLGCNLPIGPLALADLMGTDVLLSVLDTLSAEYGDKYRAAPLLRQMVRAGQLGRKAGQGFYKY